MLSNHQILRQAFGKSGSYQTTRDPSRDCEFVIEIFEIFLTKISRDRPNLRGWVLVNMHILGSNSRKSWFLCWTYWWCTLRSKLKQSMRFTMRVMAQFAISKFWFCKDRYLYRKTLTPNGESCRKHIIRHYIVPPLEAKYAGRDYVFECDLAAPTTRCLHSPL